jgi:hypothetical protein
MSNGGGCAGIRDCLADHKSLKINPVLGKYFVKSAEDMEESRERTNLY